MNTIVVAVVALVVLAAIFGAVLGFAAIKFKVDSDPLVDEIDAILPQTQCGQCGYPGCRPYAQAIANGDDINKCAPGGVATIENLAALLGVDVQEAAYDVSDVKKVAFIDESMCIGCTKCLQACPVDAISGSTKVVHTVITDECTGCDLCVAPCPTDCIHMVPLKSTPENWQWNLTSIPIENITDKDKTINRSEHSSSAHKKAHTHSVHSNSKG